jgi:hypothetical protein
VNIYFAWKPDSLQFADAVGGERGPTTFAGGSGEEGESGRAYEAVSRVSGKAEAGCMVRTRCEAQLEGK